MRKTNFYFWIPLFLLVVVLLLSFTALLFVGSNAIFQSQAAAQTNPISAGPPTSTPTNPPPPPKVEYTPVAPDTVSPIVVQRFPRRGEAFPPDGKIELVFDRAMDQTATAAAFTLQTAADQPQSIAGSVAWPDERTMEFVPDQALDRATTYDLLLTQTATADDGAPLAEPFTFRFSTPGYLEVAQVIPADGTTDVETDSTITVMFNRPVVPLTSLEEAEQFPQPLEFEPAIAGQGEWLNTSIYVFTPAGDLPGGATFSARVKAGLTDVTGQTLLPDDFEWRFVTQPPEVTFTRPNDGQTLVPVETEIQVTFNQPVDPQSAQANFSLNPGGLFGQAVAGEFLVQDNSLTFTPTTRLEFDTTYEVTVEAGVTSPAGGQGMVTPYTFRFTTVPLPKIVGTEPRNGEKNAWPHTDFRIIFNTRINPATVMDHVEMTPPLPITPTQVYTYYSPWDNSFGFNFGAQPSTDYEVRIRPGIEDPYGNTTQESLTVRFRTAPLEPTYRLRVPDLIGTYDADLPAKLLVSFVNVNQINLRLYRLPAEEILRPTREWNEYRPGSDLLLRQWQERLEAPADKQSFQPIELVQGGGSLEPGLYYLETDSPQVQDRGYYSGHRHLLVVSQTNLTMKTGPQEAMVWATDLATGQPLSGLPVTFYDEDRRQLGTATTDNDGLARLDLAERSRRSQILAVVLANEGDQVFTAVSENWARGISPYEFGLNLAYNLPDFAVHIYTDRPIYRPGQVVHFKGSIRAEDDVDFRLPDLGQVQVTVFDAAYETVLDETVDLSPTGSFNSEVELAEGAALGNYTIALDFADQHFEHYFQVAAYRPPEFEVVVEPDASELSRGEDIEATI